MQEPRKIKLIKSAISGLEPGSKQYVVWDTEVTGFGLRVYPSGRKTFILIYRPRGGRRSKQRTLTLGKFGTITPAEARDLARNAVADLHHGIDPQNRKMMTRSAPTVADLIDDFIKERPGKPKAERTWTRYESQLDRHVRPRIGSLLVQEVAHQHIVELHAGLRDRPTEANRLLAPLSGMFRFAERKNLRPSGSNPVRGIDKNYEKPRDRYLNADEIARLGSALAALESEGANVYGVAIIRLMLLRGLRGGEARTLRWSNIDRNSMILRLTTSKTGVSTFPISEAELALLDALPQLSEWVFPGRDSREPISESVYRRILKSALKRAGIEDFRPHDLRHTAATALAASGLSATAIRDFLGHKTLAMANRYVARLNNELRDQFRASVAKTAERLGLSQVHPSA